MLLGNDENMRLCLCIFHRRNLIQRDLDLNGTMIRTSNTINILGITFDSKMKWAEQVNGAIKEANKNLYGIRMIKKYFTSDMVKSMITAIHFAKLYNTELV